MRVVRAYAPGRTELAGNHTDHQGGRVIAAAVSCGVEVVARANGTNVVNLESVGFPPVQLDVADLMPRADERGTTAALVRGVLAGLAAADVPVCGFDASVTSTVPAGSGLSSSAAFELALARAASMIASCGDANESENVSLTHYVSSESEIRSPTHLQLALIGQRAERDYFGKPCGLMDQLAVACGGVNLFDFSQDPPVVEHVDFDFARAGYTLCLVDTHCDHSRYTNEYAQVARDMSAVARFLGADVLSQVPREEFLQRFPDIRQQLGDVPALRGLHFYNEMRLVDERAQALRAGDVRAFLQATRQSGASSAQYLQNVSTYDRASQPAMVAQALADLLLEGEGACRIHGGGFGGTVQAFVPTDRVGHFTCGIDAQLGEGSCKAYDIVLEGVN